MNTTLPWLGEVIRAKRKQQGLTLSDAAAIAGISISYWSDVERGRSLPSLTTLQGMADALGLRRASSLLALAEDLGEADGVFIVSDSKTGSAK